MQMIANGIASDTRSSNDSNLLAFENLVVLRENDAMTVKVKEVEIQLSIANGDTVPVRSPSLVRSIIDNIRTLDYSTSSKRQALPLRLGCGPPRVHAHWRHRVTMGPSARSWA